jgi:cephalosporin-C deacetylase-like acetyl esterase
MQRLSLPLVVVLLAITHPAAAQNAAAGCRLTVATDRPDAIYAAGETATFRVVVDQGDPPAAGAKIVYQIDRSDTQSVAQGELPISKSPIALKGSLNEPGFLLCRVRCMVNGKKVAEALAGAGFAPLQIKPSLPVPSDFDAFWAAQKARLKTVPMKAALTPVASPVQGVECFDLQVACVPPRPVSGYFARPRKATAKSLPAILHVHGAGVYSASLGTAASAAKRYHALSLDINAHGILNGKPDEYYQALDRGELRGYRHEGRENRETCYFLGMFLRVVRALDFLASQPEWDSKSLIVEGHSQGGGQSIAAAGLDSRVTLIAAGVPAICDHSARVVGRSNGWPKLVPDVDGKPDPKILNVARYFDCMNLATRAKAEAYVSVGFIDTDCSPASVYATFNNLAGEKHILAKPWMPHAAPEEIQQAFRDAMVKHIAKLQERNPSQ